MQVVRRPRAPVLVPLIAELGVYTGDIEHHYEKVLPSGSQDLMVNLHADRFWAYDPEAVPAHAPPTGPTKQGRAGPHAPHRPTAIQGGEIGGAVFSGAHSAPTIADTGDQRVILNVHFRPAGAFPFFGPAATAAGGRLVELDALWGQVGRTLRERLLDLPPISAKCELPHVSQTHNVAPTHVAQTHDVLRVLETVESVLLGRLRHCSGPDPAVRFAVAALERGTPVAEVTDALGWTSKRLVRRFTTHVGLSPKRYARVRRLQRVLRSVEPTFARPGAADPDWARVAYEHGFYDQAHFVNDFKALTGITPTDYRPRAPGEHNHVPLAT